MSTIGRMYKEPRVFAHDAHPIIVGAINYTWKINRKVPPSSPLNWGGITVTNAGNGGVNPYVVDDTITLSAGSGTVPGVLTVDAVDADGLITDYSFDPTTLTNLGAGYLVGDSLTQAGTTSAAGTGFTCDITNIDIPNTEKAGCNLYVGAAAGLTTLQVIMDGAEIDLSTSTGYTTASTITFGTVSAGSFLPIMVKQIVGTYAANDVLALY